MAQQIDSARTQLGTAADQKAFVDTTFDARGIASPTARDVADAVRSMQRFRLVTQSFVGPLPFDRFLHGEYKSG